MLISRLLPERQRGVFIASYVVMRILAAIFETKLFHGHPPVPLVIAVSIGVALLMWQVATQLGWYEAEPAAAVDAPPPFQVPVYAPAVAEPPAVAVAVAPPSAPPVRTGPVRLDLPAWRPPAFPAR